jgi:hypothetical protein
MPAGPQSDRQGTEEPGTAKLNLTLVPRRPCWDRVMKWGGESLVRGRCGPRLGRPCARRRGAAEEHRLFRNRKHIIDRSEFELETQAQPAESKPETACLPLAETAFLSDALSPIIELPGRASHRLFHNRERTSRSRVRRIRVCHNSNSASYIYIYIYINMQFSRDVSFRLSVLSWSIGFSVLSWSGATGPDWPLCSA